LLSVSVFVDNVSVYDRRSHLEPLYKVYKGSSHIMLANFCKVAGQGCRAKMPGKAAGQDCRARLPGKAAGQDCRAKLTSKTAGQDCRARLPGKTAEQDCRARLPGTHHAEGLVNPKVRALKKGY
jgi:hypothetical protein